MGSRHHESALSRGYLRGRTTLARATRALHKTYIPGVRLCQEFWHEALLARPSTLRRVAEPIGIKRVPPVQASLGWARRAPLPRGEVEEIRPEKSRSRRR